MNEVQIAWLAGLLEGEGCFHFQRTAIITLQMTDEDIVRRASEIMKSSWHAVKRCQPGRKRVYVTSICADRAMEIMKTILPHMGARRTAKINEVFDKCAARKGFPCGEKASSSRLTDEQAAEIRRLYIKGNRDPDIGAGALAKRFGVSYQAIHYVVKKRRDVNGQRPWNI